MQLYSLNAKENTFWKTQGFIFNYFEEFDKLRNPDKVFPDKSDEDSAIRTAMELL